ncbi:Protein CBG17572 [Caenorhabditis briggsae]|uniref:Protein CBG17572 n=1 Tax=Caenorhabditis briggsae TaxID=6238 RepID=A8XR97_CAEBR|nr:Protein CBG17572 [Caenorhabditis briggsae]CAP35194.2 Protein CBG17572 [Caenorhabditis briggsae]
MKTKDYRVPSVLANFPTNDLLKKESFCTTDPFKEFHYPPTILNGDLSPSYEFNVLFHHNCTQGGLRRWACYYSPEPLAFCPVDGEQTVAMDVWIGNKWNSKECWPLFADPIF